MINWIDILLLAVIALYAYIGFRRGFILSVVDLIAWLGSLIVSFLLFPYVALALQKLIPSLGAWVNVISFLVAFMAVRLVVSLLLSLAVARIPNHVQVSPVNKFFGIIPGVFSGIVTAVVIALLIMVVPWTDGLAEQARNSKVADELTRPAAWVEDKVSPVIDSVINKTVASLMVEPESEASVRLPFTTTHVTARPGLETQMLQLVNEERIKQGLQALKPDTALTSVARAHSRDMFARGYFSHYTPEGKDPFERMRAGGISFLAAGENLALAQTVHIAHNGLMHSPGHRANILNPAFKKVGIGVIAGGMHGLMISQEFKN